MGWMKRAEGRMRSGLAMWSNFRAGGNRYALDDRRRVEVEVAIVWI